MRVTKPCDGSSVSRVVVAQHTLLHLDHDHCCSLAHRRSRSPTRANLQLLLSFSLVYPKYDPLIGSTYNVLS
jgi:hypothetical protein